MRNRILYAIVITLIAALALTGVGCSKDGVSLGGGGGKGVAATVNGEEILESEVQAELDRAAAANPGMYDGDEGAARRESDRLQVIDYLVQQALFLQAAADKGIEVTDEDVATEIDMLKTSYGDEDTWNEALAQSGHTEETLDEMIRAQVMTRKLAESVAAEELAAEPSDDEIQAYYDQNEYLFSTPAERLGRHILVADEAAAQAALARVKGGEEFATVAAEVSEDPGSKDSGGDLGWSDGNGFVEGFREAYQTLPVGEISDLVKTDFGYHIIQILEDREASVMPVEDAREQIVQDIRNTNANATFNAFIEELHDSATIVIYDTEGNVWEDPAPDPVDMGNAPAPTE